MSKYQDKSVSADAGGVSIASGVVESGRPNERLRWVADASNLTLQDRLKFAAGLVPLSEMARKINRSSKQLARYLSGADVPASILNEIAFATGLPVDWLVSGFEVSETQVLDRLGADRTNLSDRSDGSGLSPALLGDFAMIPRYEVSASAGAGTVALTETASEQLAFRRDWLKEIGVSPAYAQMLSADGDSMEPLIPDGALMLIDTSIRDVRNGCIYVIVKDGDLLVKRVHRKLDGTISLISENPRYDPEVVSADFLDKLHIVGRVRWVGRTI